MNYQMITTDDDLRIICEAVSATSAVALDMEFVRTRTYYPQLDLLQLFDGTQVSLIDLLMISDWVSMRGLLLNQDVTKYLRTGSEDLEVFFNAFSPMSQPLIDTRILAVFCGRPMSWGFALMVGEYSGVALGKSEPRTDWLAYPLTECQREYAAADVWYLSPIVSRLMVETDRAGWLLAALDECRLTQQCRQEVVDPVGAWRDTGNAWQLRTRQLGCLQLLVEWRLRKARERDLVANFVAREEHLQSVAHYMPTSLGEFDSLGLFGSEIRSHGKTLTNLVEKTQVLLESALPASLQNLIDMPGYRKTFKDVKALVQEVGADKGVSAELLASCRQISQLLNWHQQLRTQAGEPELISG